MRAASQWWRRSQQLLEVTNHSPLSISEVSTIHSYTDSHSLSRTCCCVAGSEWSARTLHSTVLHTLTILRCMQHSTCSPSHTTTLTCRISVLTAQYYRIQYCRRHDDKSSGEQQHTEES